MVLALAGAALLYSGCTKDYQKDIDDLNTEVATLQNTVQKLQDQVSALEELRSRVSALENADKELKTLIDACNAEIKKIQEGYATKEELESGLTALKNEITETLNGLAADVKDNTEAIAALQDAYKAMGEFEKALNSDKIASVVLVPTSPVYETMYQYSLDVFDFAPFVRPETVVTSEPQLYLNYAVRPAGLAAELSSENTTLHVVYDKDYYLPVRFLDADGETGNVMLVADIDSDILPEKFFKQVAFPFSLDVEDVAENGILNSISSPFNFALIPNKTTKLEYQAYAEETGEPVSKSQELKSVFPPYQIPWNEFATSQRTFFDGYSVGLFIENWDAVLPLETAAYLLNVDVADITPEYKFAVTTNGKIKTDAQAWTAQMKAADEKEAKDAQGAGVTATATAYLNIDFHRYDVLDMSQDYKVVAAKGADLVIETRNLHWIGKNFVGDQDLNNVPISGKLTNITTLSCVTKDAKGNVYPYKVKVTPDEELVSIALPGDLIAFTPEAQELIFVGEESVKNNTVTNTVTFTLTLDPKPADKKLDLGVFTTDGSLSEEVVVSLEGIVAALVNGDEDLYANVSYDKTKKSPLYNAIAEEFNKTNKITKIGVEYANGSLAKVELPLKDILNFYIEQKAGKDASTLELFRAVYGATYSFWGEITDAYGVKYEYTFKVAVNPPDYALVTTPYVSEGNIINVKPEYNFTSWRDGQYTINDVYFTQYFQVDKKINDDLSVAFIFDYEYYLDAKKNPVAYNGNAKWCDTEDIVAEDQKPYYVKVIDGQVLARERYLRWNTYSGRQISGVAVLIVSDNFGNEYPVGEPVEFTLVTPDPIKTFEVAPITTDERIAGKEITVDLASSLTITSQIDGKPIKQSGSYLKGEHSWNSYGIVYGFIDEDGVVTTKLDKFVGTLNGKEYTFVEGRDYKLTMNNARKVFEITFLENSAEADIVFTLPVGISHLYGYNWDPKGYAEHTADLVVTIPQHKQDAPAGE